jgi:pimeloyl-ACP methyl ester carboxylesterase
VSEEISSSPARRRRLARQIRAAPRVASELLWLGIAVARHDTRSHLGVIACPTLVLTGRNDHLIPSRLQDALAAGIPKSTRAFVSEAGHAVTIDRPEETARIVLRFVRGDPPMPD